MNQEINGEFRHPSPVDCTLQDELLTVMAEGPLEYRQGNFDIRVEQDLHLASKRNISIVVLNLNQEAVGKLSIAGIPGEVAAARILEQLYDADQDRQDAAQFRTLPAQRLHELLKEAQRYTKEIQSDFGRNNLDMIENYQRMIACRPNISTRCEAHRLPEVQWTDICLPIADKTGLSEPLATKVEELAPGTLSKHAPMKPLFLDLRLFSLDPQDDCKVTGSKVCFFLVDGEIVTLHETASEIIKTAQESLTGQTGGSISGIKPSSVFCAVAQRVLDQNDQVIEREEDVLDSINRELLRSGTLSKERVDDDIPDLLDSLRYCFRKFEAMGRAFSRLLRTLRSSNTVDIDQPSGQGNVLNTLQELSDVASTLQGKTKDLMEQARQVLETYKLNLGTEYERSQKKSGLVQAITLPLSIGLATAALMANRGAQPITVALISFAVTLGLAGWGMHKNWF